MQRLNVSHGFLARHSDASALIRSIDWTRTPVGAIRHWPSSLKNTLGVMTRSRTPMMLWWGEELIQFHNDAFMTSGGTRCPDVMGQRAAELWPDVWPTLSRQVGDVMDRGAASGNAGPPDPLLRQGRFHDVYWEYGFSPVVDDDGGVLGALVLFNDVTRRILSERRRKASQALADALSRSASDDAIVRDTAAALAAAHQDIVSMLFYRVQDEPFSVDLCPDVHAARKASALDLSIRSQLYAKPSLLDRLKLRHSVRLVDHLLVPLPGTYPPGVRRFIAFGINARLILDDDYREFLDHISACVAHASNRLEAALIRQRADTERDDLLMQAPLAVAVLSGPDLVFSLANPLFLDLVGAREPIGKCFEEAFPELVDTPVPDWLHRSYDTGARHVSAEARVMCGGSGAGPPEERHLQFTLHPMRTAKGDVHGLIVVAVDMTRPVQMRQAEAQTAERAKSAFLDHLSDELRTPMNAIIGLTHLLARDAPDSQQQARIIGKVSAAARQLMGLLDAVLDLSSIEAGTLRLERTSFQTRTVIERALDQVASRARDKRLELVVETAGLPPHLWGDPRRLSHILGHLLTNAVEYTDRGWVRLRACTVETTGRKVYLRFEVEDSGPGIPAAQQARVFEPFQSFQEADASRSRRHGGTGLGLALVVRLSRAMGGNAGVTSREGVGSRFWFTARLERDAEPDQRMPHAPQPASEALLRTAHAGWRVLLADDNPVNRQLAEQLLRAAGLVVEIACDGAQAVDMALAGSYHAVLMELQMPVKDGLEATREIRSAGQDLPIIAMTASAFNEDRQACIDAGINDHLTKPVDPAAMYTALLRWWGGTPPADQNFRR